MAVPRPSRHPELSEEGLAALGAGNACDREPIHLSGAVQPHGFLLVVEPESSRVLAASTNTPRLPEDDPVSGVPLVDLVGSRVAEIVAGLSPPGNPHDALAMPVEVVGADGSPATFDLVVHRRETNWVLEFEPRQAVEDAAPAQIFQRQRDAVRALHSLQDVDAICQLTVAEVRELTGFDRAMVYRFDGDASGQVIAEACRTGLDPYLGLHYPAGDIPRQARALYLRNWIRVVADVDYQPAPLRALTDDLDPAQVDLSMAVLRSVSPVHLQYLKNMGVAATLTISLVADNQLWGMIACHHEVPRRVDHQVRLACEALGQLVSVRLRAAELAAEQEYAQQLGRMTGQVVTAMAAAESPPFGAIATSDALLGMVGADGVVVEIDRVRVSAGAVPEAQPLQVLVTALAEQAGAGTAPLATTVLGRSLSLPTPSGPVGGALYLPLGGRGSGFVLWLRREQAAAVDWAGRHVDPDGLSPDGAVLTPRASFALWREEVRGRSLPWRPAELAAATEFAQAMPEVLMHRAQNRLVRMALHDPLTGLPNRLQLQERLTDLLSGRPVPSLDSHTPHQIAVLFIDVDGFKQVNDSEGHLIGDELLVLAAERISKALRAQDFVARIGGDEFVAVLPVGRSQEAIDIGQRVVEAFRCSFLLGGRSRHSISASVGLTTVTPGTDPADAVRQADAAMYRAKQAGRDQLAVHEPETGVATSYRQTEAEELREAIVAGHIEPFYQAIVSLRGRPTLHGFEALARWYHPVRGLVPPDHFIPIAEETGLINALGDLVLRRALQQLRSWVDPALTLSVNVSVRQLVRPGFAGEVIGHLIELGIDPARLSLEVTETQMMEEPDLALAALDELTHAGVRIAIDDFGIGFSSLAYVRNLPAQILKIDKLFVSGLPHHHPDVAVVTATIQLAHSLGMETVAEGVETMEQLTLLRELGSDFAQGYLLGRPVPADELPAATRLPVPTLASAVDGMAVAHPW